MSDALSLAEIDGQRVELLPARTVLSLFSAGGAGRGGNGGLGGHGAVGRGGIGASLINANLFGDQTNLTGSGTGGEGGAGAGGTGGAISS
ncbi:MAG: hypothetical protein ACRDRW_08525 [Pseudonocardiaceae bacterium]